MGSYICLQGLQPCGFVDGEFKYEEKPVGLKSSLVNLILNVDSDLDLLRYTRREKKLVHKLARASALRLYGIPFARNGCDEAIS